MDRITVGPYEIISQRVEVQAMGNRDKRGREKKKPKKKEISGEKSRPARPVPEYKPPVPTPQQPTNTSSGESDRSN